MKHHIPPLAAALVAAPLALFGQNNPPAAAMRPAPVAVSAASPAPKDTAPDHALLLLAGIPNEGAAAEIIARARVLSAATDSLQDPVLRARTRLALARIESEPENARAIRDRHLKWLVGYSYGKAEKLIKADDAWGAADFLLLATRGDPSHIRARLHLADILNARFRFHEEAASTLRRGLPFLDLASPEAGRYLHLYFHLLETLCFDREAADFAHGLLEKQTNLPAALREPVALRAVNASFRIGDYAKAVAVIRKHNLKGTQNRLLEALCLFNAGDTAAAIALLHKTVSETKGAERDAVLRQIAGFHATLGQREQALRVAKQRVNEFPQNAQARVNCLYLFDPVQDRAEYERTLRHLFENHATDQSAVFALATFASRRGNVELAALCHRLSAESQKVSRSQSAAPGSRHYVNRQSGFNHAAFTCSFVETLVRAKRPREAVDACRDLGLYDKQFIRDTGGVINALLAAAYLSLGDKETARLYIEEFLHEKNEDPKPFVRFRELLDQRDNAPTEAARRDAVEEIERIARRPRDIPAHTYIAVASLLRFVKADAEALLVLENGARDHPSDSRIKAACISARIALGAFAAAKGRKDLLTETEELLRMRRPEPQIWMEISRWLNSPGAPADPRVEPLRATLSKLVRPDFTSNPDFS
jgi:tetratricopeptide (TPR) repeat protein